MKKLVLSILLFAHSYVFAENEIKDERWEVITNRTHFGAISLDTKTVSVNNAGTNVTAWIKTEKGKCNETAKAFNCYYVLKYRAYCEQSLLETIQMNIYNKKSLQMVSNFQGSEKESIIPESTGEEIYNALCEYSEEPEIESSIPPQPIEKEKKESNYEGLKVIMDGLGKIINGRNRF